MSSQSSESVIQMKCLDLLMRLPPHNIRDNLTRLFPLVSEGVMEGVLSSVDQPFVEMVCESTKKKFLGCDYNRDADSYRSPWSNVYQPSLEEGGFPSAELRELEIVANRAMDLYRDRYYDSSGTASVYFWDTDDTNFSGAILIKRGCKLDGCSVCGCWDSLHVFEMKEKTVGKKVSAMYSFTSTIMLWLKTEKESGFVLDLSGSLNSQRQQEYAIQNRKSHIANIGRIVEKMENDLRGSLSTLYFGKTSQLVTQVRSMQSEDQQQKKKDLQSELAKSLIIRSKAS